MRSRTLLLVLALRALGVLCTVALLVVYAFSDRVAGWLPHTRAFVVVFTCTGVALVFWFHWLTKRIEGEDQPSRMSDAHFASSPRTKRRHRRHRP